MVGLSALFAVNMGCATTAKSYNESPNSNIKSSKVYKGLLADKYFIECEKYNKDIDTNRNNLIDWYICHLEKLIEIADVCVREGYKKSRILNTEDRCFEIIIKKQASEDPSFFSNIDSELLDIIEEYCETER